MTNPNYASATKTTTPLPLVSTKSMLFYIVAALLVFLPKNTDAATVVVNGQTFAASHTITIDTAVDTGLEVTSNTFLDLTINANGPLPVGFPITIASNSLSAAMTLNFIIEASALMIRDNTMASPGVMNWQITSKASSTITLQDNALYSLYIGSSNFDQTTLNFLRNTIATDSTSVSFNVASTPITRCAIKFEGNTITQSYGTASYYALAFHGTARIGVGSVVTFTGNTISSFAQTDAVFMNLAGGRIEYDNTNRIPSGGFYVHHSTGSINNHVYVHSSTLFRFYYHVAGTLQDSDIYLTSSSITSASVISATQNFDNCRINIDTVTVSSAALSITGAWMRTGSLTMNAITSTGASAVVVTLDFMSSVWTMSNCNFPDTFAQSARCLDSTFTIGSNVFGSSYTVTRDHERCTATYSGNAFKYVSYSAADFDATILEYNSNTFATASSQNIVFGTGMIRHGSEHRFYGNTFTQTVSVYCIYYLSASSNFAEGTLLDIRGNSMTAFDTTVPVLYVYFDGGRMIFETNTMNSGIHVYHKKSTEFNSIKIVDMAMHAFYHHVVGNMKDSSIELLGTSTFATPITLTCTESLFRSNYTVEGVLTTGAMSVTAKHVQDSRIIIQNFNAVSTTAHTLSFQMSNSYVHIYKNQWNSAITFTITAEKQSVLTIEECITYSQDYVNIGGSFYDSALTLINNQFKSVQFSSTIMENTLLEITSNTFDIDFSASCIYFSGVRATYGTIHRFTNNVFLQPGVGSQFAVDYPSECVMELGSAVEMTGNTFTLTDAVLPPYPVLSMFLDGAQLTIDDTNTFRGGVYIQHQ